jgi:guanosine-diphosphatase
MQVNGDKSKLKRNKTAFKVQVLAPTADKTPSPPPTAHSSGLQVPTDASTRSPFTSTFRSRYMTMISPRSSNYERLEGGMGPGRISHVRWFGSLDGRSLVSWHVLL